MFSAIATAFLLSSPIDMSKYYPQSMAQVMAEAPTDIGNLENIQDILNMENYDIMLLSDEELIDTDLPETIEETEVPVTGSSGTQSTENTEPIENKESTDPTEKGDEEMQVVYVVPDNEEMIALLNEQIELLAENSTSVTGTINSSVLDLMDRMVDSYPDHYKYAGFRTSSDDAYATTLFISKRATVNGNTITFSDDCKAIHFMRTSLSNYNSQVYYEVEASPNASVRVQNDTIVYTNVLDSYPTLGKKAQIPSYLPWLGIFLVGISILFNRKHS